MRSVYLSFLGLGQKNKESGVFEYHPAVYQLNNKNATRTDFVQVAEIEFLGPDRFDVIYIAVTPKSYDTHFSKLASQLKSLGAEAIPIHLDEDMSPKGQWKWFEKILAYTEPRDRLTVDLTHGFRSIPIVFSTAINFLQKAKNITIDAAYYGAFDLKDENGYVPIMDMKDFYIINEWADGVGRLVLDADARKLAEVAEKTAEFQAGELNDAHVIEALDALTHVIRNVDVNNVSSKAINALNLVREKRETATPTAKILLDLVLDKFVSLARDEPMNGYYDGAYFKTQIEIIRILLEHQLYMQAYTAMREMIGSLGMIDVKKAKVNNNAGRRKRQQYAEIFINMVQHPENQWKFGSDAAISKNRTDSEKDQKWDQMIPYYRKLEMCGVVELLRSFSKDLSDYRNGFDHAWTSKAGALADIDEKGTQFLEKLEKTIQLMHENGVIVI